jgi:glycosyltransferase involved in cell wall biosynthesis
LSAAETLFLTPVMPATGGNGLAMRAGLLVEGLARAGPVRVLVAPVFGDPGPPTPLVDRVAASVDVLTLDPEPDPVADLIDRLGDPRSRARAQALHPRPSVCRLATLAGSRSVVEASRGVALVLVMRLYLAPFLDALLLDGARRPAIALDVDDLESVTQRALGQAEEASRFERLERTYLPELDRVFVCCDEDARQVEDRYEPRSVSVVPNAVRPPASEGADSAAPHDLLFVGNLSYAPNADGARWLCAEVLPLLADATVALVGSRPTSDVRRLESDGRVTVAADVPDVAPWYRAASVAVAPLRQGGGTRIKILEALAHWRPVVATTLGARGLGVAGRDGPVLTEDTAAGFASACRRLLDDGDAAARLAQRGREMVLATATVDTVAPLIERVALDTLRA